LSVLACISWKKDVSPMNVSERMQAGLKGYEGKSSSLQASTVSALAEPV
jgi:hypothetical protein